MSDSRDYHLITIDLDDTLWPCAPAIRAAESALQAWLGLMAPRLAAAESPEALQAHRRRLLRERSDIAHDVTALRRTALELKLDEFDYPTDLADEAMEVFRRARNRVAPYADVAPVLARLRRRMRLVAVTNGNAQVEHTELRDAFDHAVTAAEAGAAKPSPAIFELAMSRVGALPHQTLHVGDDPFLDVEAARAVGMSAVWVNRTSKPWPEELDPPACELRDLTDLERWLG